MKGWRTFKCIGASALMLAVSTSPLLAVDPANGKKLALQWCASCHLVSNDQMQVSEASLPSFYDIARDDSLTEETLKTFLADPHPQMPNMSLTNSEISDLARYIKSLES